MHVFLIFRPIKLEEFEDNKGAIRIR